MRRFALDCQPELASFEHFTPHHQATRSEQPTDEAPKSLCRWQSDACLPVLHRAPTDAGSRSEFSLDQTRATTIAQQEAAKRFGRL